MTEEPWLVLHCPRCGETVRKRVSCVNALRRAEAAEARSTRAAVEIAELKAELATLQKPGSRAIAVIEATAR